MKASGFDWTLTLQQCNNQKELAAELIKILTDELPCAQKKLELALQSKDTSSIYNEIHKLHGSCTYCGMPKLKQLIIKLENEIKSKKINNLSHSINEINAEINIVSADLKTLKLQ